MLLLVVKGRYDRDTASESLIEVGTVFAVLDAPLVVCCEPCLLRCTCSAFARARSWVCTK